MATRQRKSESGRLHRERRRSSVFGAAAMTLAIAVMLPGCKVGPDYCGAPAPTHQRWIDADTDPRVCGEPDNIVQWWNQFNDPALTSLIATLDRQNLTLQAAAFRIQAARAARGIAAGSLFPQSQTANGGVFRVNASQTTATPPPVPDFDVWGLTMFDASWELDFWGKFRRNIEAAEGDLQASIGTYDDLLVSLQGETAAVYIQLRTLERRLALAQGNVELQKGSLNIAEAQFRNGAVTELDVTQARQVLAQTSALIPVFEAGIRNAKNALCVLIGTPPGSLDDMLADGRGIPAAPDAICAGVPAELLQRRPDIRAAWHTAAAQSARIGVAITDLYPSFILTGDIGYESQSLSNLFNTRSVSGLAGPSFSWKILNYGRIKNNIRLQEDLLQSELANYQQTVLTAYREVEDGLNSFTRTHDQMDQLRVSEAEAAKSVNIVIAQYENGAVDFNRVFTLQQNLVTQQDTLAATEGELATQVVAVYKALGGGWRARTSGYTMPAGPVPEKEPLPLPPEDEDTEEEAALDARGDAAEPLMVIGDDNDVVEPLMVVQPALPTPLMAVEREILPRLPRFARKE